MSVERVEPSPGAGPLIAPGSLSDAERRVCDVIASRADALLEDLRLHVETPTGPGQHAEIEASRTRLVDRLEALGGTSSRTPGDARPEWLSGPDDSEQRPESSLTERIRGDGARVLIAGHLDTVHHADSGFDRLTVSDDGRTATGPGCVDMKGGLVIAVAALEAIEAAGEAASWSFFLNADEETGTYHSAEALRDASRGHEWGIALEPALAGGELALERVGSGQFRIETRGRSAHVGRAFTNGVSAVTAMAETLVEVAKLPEPERGKIVSVGPLQGGTATNAVPEQAMAWGNCRFADGVVEQELAEALDGLVTDASAMPRVLVERSFSRPSKPRIPATEALALTARSVAEDLGQQLPFARTGGVCDGNIMQDAGLPTIDTLGVRGGGLHTDDEWIELASLVERCQLLAVLVMRLSGLPRSAEEGRGRQ